MNRLKNATSKYLLQHASNPVDWYPWGDEPFERAKKEGKPVLVSIGYAACHWCHVMGRESFEDLGVAEIMNQNFICIKVDKEEHPDVDKFYMDALQSLTGSGGWPLNMFVDANKKPFYGGTYFPPQTTEGRLSWTDTLLAVARVWETKHDEVMQQSAQMMNHLKEASLAGMMGKHAYLDKESIETICRNLLANADTAWGGFGAAPKFPMTFSLRFLFEFYQFQKNKGAVDQLGERALLHATLSLDKMLSGGIYDQVGGGVFRYSTDEFWHIPHYEKMLYDNALMISLLSTAYRVTQKPHYKRALKEIVAFCNRELKHPDLPGFYCSLDADQAGVEGGFYLWNTEEWVAALENPHPAIDDYFRMDNTELGDEAHPLLGLKTDEEICRKYHLGIEDWEQLLFETKKKLLDFRSWRKHPGIDDKMLLSWNALMNKALQDAAFILEDKNILKQAKLHLQWLEQVFCKDEGQWKRIYNKGKTHILAKLDDYAYLIQSMISFASQTGENEYLIKAKEATEKVIELFGIADRPYFYYSSINQNDIPVRKVEIYDGAEPSVNAIMTENLRLMGDCFGHTDWKQQAHAMLTGVEETVRRYARSFSYWAILIQHEANIPKQIVFARNFTEDEFKEWKGLYLPEVFSLKCREKEENILLLQEKYMNENQQKIFLCYNNQCLNSFSTLTELKTEIKKIN